MQVIGVRLYLGAKAEKCFALALGDRSKITLVFQLVSYVKMPSGNCSANAPSPRPEGDSGENILF